MAFIGFGKIDKNIIPLILGCVFCLLNRLVNSYQGTKLFHNVILTNIFVTLSHSLILIPYIIYRIITKKCGKKKKVEEAIEFSYSFREEKVDETKKSKYIYNGNVIKKAKRKFLFAILTGLIFFVNHCLFIYTIPVKSNTWTIYIVFTSLFYYLIFKSKLFIHHYLSIGLILVFSIIIDLVVENFQTDAKDQLGKFFLSILRVILLSLNYVLIKYTMEKKYVSLYLLGTINGIINFVLFVIFGVLDHFYFHINNDYIEYFKNFDTTEFLVLLGIMSTQLGLYTMLLLVDKNDSPCHIFIVFTFGQFGYYFYTNLYNGVKLAVIIIFFILMLFFSLVFNEIIELRFLGLAYNTKRNIAERANLDSEDAMIIRVDTDKSEDIEMSNKVAECN